MKIREAGQLLGVELSRQQLRAGEYLERLGQRFCIDFGYDNAVQKARDHWRSLVRKRNKRRSTT